MTRMPTAAMDVEGGGQVEVTGEAAIEVIDVLRQVECGAAARRIGGASGQAQLRLALDGLEMAQEAMLRRGRDRR